MYNRTKLNCCKQVGLYSPLIRGCDGVLTAWFGLLTGSWVMCRGRTRVGHLERFNCYDFVIILELIISIIRLFRNTSSDELAEAASKIGLMSPEQFEPSLPPPDLGRQFDIDPLRRIEKYKLCVALTKCFGIYSNLLVSTKLYVWKLLVSEFFCKRNTFFAFFKKSFFPGRHIGVKSSSRYYQTTPPEILDSLFKLR